jgi:hypothetical protein
MRRSYQSRQAHASTWYSKVRGLQPVGSAAQQCLDIAVCVSQTPLDVKLGISGKNILNSMNNDVSASTCVTALDTSGLTQRHTIHTDMLFSQFLSVTVCLSIAVFYCPLRFVGGACRFAERVLASLWHVGARLGCSEHLVVNTDLVAIGRGQRSGTLGRRRSRKMRTPAASVPRAVPLL